MFNIKIHNNNTDVLYLYILLFYKYQIGAYEIFWL